MTALKFAEIAAEMKLHTHERLTLREYNFPAKSCQTFVAQKFERLLILLAQGDTLTPID